MKRRSFLCAILLLVLVLPAWAGGGADSRSRARFVFLFIGDGMGPTQLRAASLFHAARPSAGASVSTKFAMDRFPVRGTCATHPLRRKVTDSAAAGTALSCGFKTTNGTVCMDGSHGKRFRTVAEMARDKGMKVGILTSVSLDHATPACFYAHRPSRNMYYEIATDLVRSGFDYFAGGGFRKPGGRKGQPNIMDLAREKGYTIVRTRKQLRALTPGGGKAIAIDRTLDRHGALWYELDRPDDHISLAEFTRRGIELLEGPDGFFMMVEGGKIDWACHANDAAAAVTDTIAFDRAVGEAVTFFERHPNDTLIVATADHETGGMTLRLDGEGRSASIGLLARQKVSYIEFDKKLKAFAARRRGAPARFEDVLPLVGKFYGLDLATLAPDEVKALRRAFALSLGAAAAGPASRAERRLYGSYEPFTTQVARALARKAGITWKTHSHTPTPVPVMAMGVGQEGFRGEMDNTDVARRIMGVLGLSPRSEGNAP